MTKIEMKILIGLHRNINILDKITSKIASEHNLTFSQFMVLEALYSKGPMSVGEVRDRILSSVGTIPLIINNLVKMNYVRRFTDIKDKRICMLDLTKDGYNLINKIAPKNEKNIIDTLDVLTESEKNELLRILKKISNKKDK